MTERAGTINRRTFLAAGTALAAAPGLRAAAQPEGDAPMLRVAMLSKWHPHAQGYGTALKNMPDVAITAVWDEVPERGREWAEALGAPFVESLDAVYARDDVDGVAINAPTNMHADIMVAAADAGKHIFTEKVMALTVAECDRIAAAVREAGVVFCISYPFLTRPEVQYAQQAVRDGLIGQLSFVRVRVAHNAGSADWLPPHFWDPVQTGGGAMMDLGAHPMYTIRAIGGQPKRISSTFTYMTGHEVEDNAVSVVEFEDKVIGVAETSFMSTHSPFSLEVSGTEGGIFVGGPEERLLIRSTKTENKEWHTPDTLPERMPAPARMWVDGVLNGAPIPFGLEEGTQLTELMEYAYKAHAQKRQVEIPAR